MKVRLAVTYTRVWWKKMPFGYLHSFVADDLDIHIARIIAQYNSEQRKAGLNEVIFNKAGK